MKSRTWLHLLAVAAIGLFFDVNAQTFDVRITQSVTATDDTVTIEIRRTGATSFVLGTSSFVFNYNTAALYAPVKLAALDGPWDSSDPDYQDLARVRDSVIGFAGLSVEFIGTDQGGGDDDNGPEVPTSYTRVGVLRFPIKNSSLTPGLSWRSIGVVTQTFKLTSPGTPAGGQTEITANGTYLPPSDPPLPVQISSFTATVINQSQVQLDWTTQSELNNFGFEVQKSPNTPDNYQTITNSFVPGHGTTNIPHNYTYVDVTAAPGNWYYRLKQIDLDGAVHYTDGIQVDVLTSVKEKPVPTEFSVGQNYPNPFNPSTMIDFALPWEAHVKLEVFNLLGQRVATLVDETRTVGYHSVQFNASELPTGLYFYRMQAGSASTRAGQAFVQTKKLTILK